MTRNWILKLNIITVPTILLISCKLVSYSHSIVAIIQYVAIE